MLSNFSLKLLLAATVSICIFALAQTQNAGNIVGSPKKQPICDSEGFIESAKEAEELRLRRLLSESDFARIAQKKNTVVLDARSESSYKSLRVKGSKNLPYTAFSDKTLQELIPDRSTRILIYCRNNLVNNAPNRETQSKQDRHPYPDELDDRQNVIKAPKVALNIPTYITLSVYGYDNVWQLDALVDPNNSLIEFEGKWPAEDDRE